DADEPWEELQGRHRDLPRAEPRPEFQPANDVERSLLRAASDNDHDLFLQTLADAEVLLPVGPDADFTLRPGRAGFAWQTREVDGATLVQVFTSPERLAETSGPGADSIRVPFPLVLRYWPDHANALAVNPGSPAGGTILAEQLPGLATWADQRAARRMSEEFEAQNEVEQRLFDAAVRRDTDAFFKVLLGSQVLVPADPETPWGITPDDPEFPWRPARVHGRVAIQLFTSLRWMNEAVGSSRFVMPTFLEVVAAWPDADWTLVLNPGTPVDAAIPGEQVRALSGPAEPSPDQAAAETPFPAAPLADTPAPKPEASAETGPVPLSATAPERTDTPAIADAGGQANVPGYASTPERTAADARTDASALTGATPHADVPESAGAAGRTDIPDASDLMQTVVDANPEPRSHAAPSGLPHVDAAGRPDTSELAGEATRTAANPVNVPGHAHADAHGQADTSARVDAVGGADAAGRASETDNAAPAGHDAPASAAAAERPDGLGQPVPAEHADTAGHPSRAGQADASDGTAAPGHTNIPGRAETATPADTPGYTNVAEQANTADRADTPGYADTAAQADTADRAETTGYANVAGQTDATHRAESTGQADVADQAKATGYASDAGQANAAARPEAAAPANVADAGQAATAGSADIAVRTETAGRVDGSVPERAVGRSGPDPATAAERPADGGPRAEDEAEGGAEPEFEPGNRIDQELFEAALAGDSDAFLRVLLAANVLVPIPQDAPLEVTPTQREFRWEAALRGPSAVQVFTSLVRLREVLPESRFVYADFRELIAAWPRDDWAMLLNPRTRIGASLRGDQVRALSEWAIRVGLIQPVPEPEPDPSTLTAFAHAPEAEPGAVADQGAVAEAGTASAADGRAMGAHDGRAAASGEHAANATAPAGPRPAAPTGPETAERGGRGVAARDDALIRPSGQHDNVAPTRDAAVSDGYADGTVGSEQAAPGEYRPGASGEFESPERDVPVARVPGGPGVEVPRGPRAGVPGMPGGSRPGAPDVAGVRQDDAFDGVAAFGGAADRRRAAEPDGELGTEPTIMQKVVPHAHVAWYLDQGYDRVGGFVHPTSDVAELLTPGQLYETLGLLYEESPFSPADDSVHVIRWPAYCPDLYRVPFGGSTEEDVASWGEAGWVVERPPFGGDGFAPGSAGSIREYKVDSVRLPFGAEMYVLGRDGSERFVAMYDPDRLAWLRPEGATPAGRTEVAR
ncbi:SseB family protein, partial [Spirillospora sp. NPDC049652]